MAKAYEYMCSVFVSIGVEIDMVQVERSCFTINTIFLGIAMFRHYNVDPYIGKMGTYSLRRPPDRWAQRW